MSSPNTPRVVGTLIVVVLKAKNLPNKRSIGKQDPYCSLQLGKELLRTKPVKKGGQHPEWDEELRFSLLEDTEDVLARTAGGGGDDDEPPPVPSKTPVEPKFNKNKKMRLAAYADDPREPELIGDVNVSLVDVLTKGETDEWYTLQNKGRDCGEVYLEMTFWSNAKAPQKKANPRPSVSGGSMYGGPGSFTPSSELTPERSTHPGRSQSRDYTSNHGRRPSHSPQPPYRGADEIMPDENPRLPDSLRPSASLAKLDLYSPAYESRPSASGVSPSVSRGRVPYDEFGSASSPSATGYGARRRESFPPLTNHQQYSSAPGSVSSAYGSGSGSGAGSLGYGYGPPQSASQGFSRVPSGSLADDMNNLSLRSSSSSYGSVSGGSSLGGRPLPHTTGSGSSSTGPTRPAFYEPSYPTYSSYSSLSSSSSLSASVPSSSGFQTQPTGTSDSSSSFYPPRNSPSPLPPQSTGFMSPEQADYNYGTFATPRVGNGSISPGHTGVNGNGYLSQPQPQQYVQPHRTSDPGYYQPPQQPTTPTPIQQQQQQYGAPISRGESYSSGYSNSPHHLQTPSPQPPPPQQQGYNTIPSPHRGSVLSPQSTSSPYDYGAPQQQQPYQAPYNNEPTPAPYLPSTTPTPQVQPLPQSQYTPTHQTQSQSQFAPSAPSIPYIPNGQPGPGVPHSHSAPPPVQYDTSYPQQQQQPLLQNMQGVPSPGHGHGPRPSMGSSGSAHGRPLPAPAPAGQSQSQSFGGYAPTPAPVPIPQAQPYQPPPIQQAPPAPMPLGQQQQPISAYEQQQQWVQQSQSQIQPGQGQGPSSLPPPPQSVVPQRSRSLPPAASGLPVYPDPQQQGYQQQPVYQQQQQSVYEQQQPVYGQQQPVYEQHQPVYEQQQPAYEQQQPVYDQQQQQQGYSSYAAPSVYASVPPPPPLPTHSHSHTHSPGSSIVPPPPPPPLPTTPPPQHYQQQQQRYSPQPPPQGPPSHLPFSPPPPPPPLMNSYQSTSWS